MLLDKLFIPILVAGSLRLWRHFFGERCVASQNSLCEGGGSLCHHLQTSTNVRIRFFTFDLVTPKSINSGVILISHWLVHVLISLVILVEHASISCSWLLRYYAGLEIESTVSECLIETIKRTSKPFVGWRGKMRHQTCQSVSLNRVSVRGNHERP